MYYNSRQFDRTIAHIMEQYDSPYRFFLELSEYYERKGLSGIGHSRIARYEILRAFLEEKKLSGPDNDPVSYTHLVSGTGYADRAETGRLYTGPCRSGAPCHVPVSYTHLLRMIDLKLQTLPIKFAHINRLTVSFLARTQKIK